MKKLLLLVALMTLAATPYVFGAVPIPIPNADFEARATVASLGDGEDAYPRYGGEYWRQFESDGNGPPTRTWNPGVAGVNDGAGGKVDVGFGGNDATSADNDTVSKYAIVVYTRFNDDKPSILPRVPRVRDFEAAVQILDGVEFNPEATYTMTAEVGHLPGSALKPTLWNGYMLQIAVGGENKNITTGLYEGWVEGGTVIATDNNTTTVPSDQFVTATVTYTPDMLTQAEKDALAGQNIQIRLCALEDPADHSTTSHVAFDDVMLSVQVPPGVDVGDERITWSGQGVDLAPEFVGGVVPTSYSWSASPDTGVVFSDDTAEAPTVTITKGTENPSLVVVTLDVTTATGPYSGSAAIYVYDTACEAARIAQDKAKDNLADFYANCEADDEDLLLMATEWLADSSPEDTYAYGGVAPDMAASTTMTDDVTNPAATEEEDSWNTADNWVSGIPTGDVDAIIGEDQIALAYDSTTPVYNGRLTLMAGATMDIGSRDFIKPLLPESLNALGSSITMNEGSLFNIYWKGIFTSPPITLAGNAIIDVAPSTTAFGYPRIFDNAIDGPGEPNFLGANVTVKLNTRNTFPGLYSDANGTHIIEANAAGSLGLGDVTINAVFEEEDDDGFDPNEYSAILVINAEDAFADTATLTINGKGADVDQDEVLKEGEDPSDEDYVVLVMNADASVASVVVHGVTIADGTYTGGDAYWIDGTSTLTVGAPDATLPDASIGSYKTATWSGEPVTLAGVATPGVGATGATCLWTADPMDGVVITGATTPTPTITITKDTDDPSEVTVTLTATNVGIAGTATESVTIDVYDNACEMGKDLGLVTFAQTDVVGADCVTNLAEYAELAAAWLNNYEMTVAEVNP